MIAHRETVAGELLIKSAVSIMNFMSYLKKMTSPVTRLSRLLSSKTELMFSIQSGSTGPSNVINTSLLEKSSAACLIAFDIKPSVHSLLVSSKVPMSSNMVTALGLIIVCEIPLKLQMSRMRDYSSALTLILASAFVSCVTV